MPKGSHILCYGDELSLVNVRAINNFSIFCGFTHESVFLNPD